MGSSLRQDQRSAHADWDGGWHWCQRRVSFSCQGRDCETQQDLKDFRKFGSNITKTHLMTSYAFKKNWWWRMSLAAMQLPLVRNLGFWMQMAILEICELTVLPPKNPPGQKDGAVATVGTAVRWCKMCVFSSRELLLKGLSCDTNTLFVDHMGPHILGGMLLTVRFYHPT